MLTMKSAIIIKAKAVSPCEVEMKPSIQGLITTQLDMVAIQDQEALSLTVHLDIQEEAPAIIILDMEVAIIQGMETGDLEDIADTEVDMVDTEDKADTEADIVDMEDMADTEVDMADMEDMADTEVDMADMEDKADTEADMVDTGDM